MAQDEPTSPPEGGRKEEEEAAIEQFLGNNPRSTQLRLWRETLQTRARRLRQELETVDSEQASKLRARLDEMNRQIAALEHEQLIAEFVEDEVRYALAMGSIAEGERLEE